MSHLLHVMAWINLEIVQETLVMQLYTNLVMWEVILPVLLKRCDEVAVSAKVCVAEIDASLSWG